MSLVKSELGNLVQLLKVDLFSLSMWRISQWNRLNGQPGPLLLHRGKNLWPAQVLPILLVPATRQIQIQIPTKRISWRIQRCQVKTQKHSDPVKATKLPLATKLQIDICPSYTLSLFWSEKRVQRKQFRRLGACVRSDTWNRVWYIWAALNKTFKLFCLERCLCSLHVCSWEPLDEVWDAVVPATKSKISSRRILATSCTCATALTIAWMHNDSVSAAVSTQDTATCVHAGHSNVQDTGLCSLPCPGTQLRNAQQQLRLWIRLKR